jgi:hypothetical protein
MKYPHDRRLQSVVFRSCQKRFLDIPQAPLCYWLRERFFELLAGKTLGDVANVCQGLATANDPRFVRFVWEAPTAEWAQPLLSRRWVPFEKGGGYGKWFGHHFWVVDWAKGGARIKSTPNPRVQNEQYYFKEGWTYSYMASGSLGARKQVDAIFAHKSPGIFIVKTGTDIGGITNCRFGSLIGRSISATIQLPEGCVVRIPIPDDLYIPIDSIELSCIALKQHIISLNATERSFSGLHSGDINTPAILHTLEGILERLIFDAYYIAGEDLQTVLDETGTPAGWFPLIKGYDAFPHLIPAIPLDGEGVWGQCLLPGDDARLCIGPADLDTLKSSIRNHYEAGPGVKVETDESDTDAENDDDDEYNQVVTGTRIPIPTETFLEELCQKLEIHPISVYWMLKEGIENDGWRCLPEEQRLTKDRFTVLILRLLGHRWPKQIETGEAVPAWADDDGIIPMIEGTDEATLNARLRGRIAADYGDERVSSEENTFEDIMGKPLAEWIRKDFFRHHTSQFKKRPIAWHISSSKWASRPRQDAAFECLIYYQKTDGDILPKLKNQYVILLLKRLEMEQRSLENANGDLNDEQKEKKDSLRYRIQELKAFDVVLTEVTASGFGPEDLRPQLRQYAINDAMLCLKARWLKKLSGAIQTGPLVNWRDQADKTGLHEEFSTWITNAITHIDCHCAAVGPKPPPEKTLDDDPTAQDLAEMICAESDAMITEALKCACAVWWKTFDATILKPISEKIRDAKKEHQLLKEQFSHPEGDFNEQADMNRKINSMKSDINAWQKELTLKSGRGKAVRYAIESWSWPEALACESWLAEQPMFDQLSSLNGKRPPPQTVAEFIRQESLYQPDINDGVRVNIAPLQKAGLLAADVLAGKDVVKSIADRAAWRDDERRWCREGKLPKPGWWE